MKKPKLGSGKRFKALTDDLESKGQSKESAKALAAWIGRRKYGKSKMAAMAAKGRKKK